MFPVNNYSNDVITEPHDSYLVETITVSMGLLEDGNLCDSIYIVNILRLLFCSYKLVRDRQTDRRTNGCNT